MPSLKALGEFKSSFNRIGKEAQALKERKLPFDDLPLPDHEAVEPAPPPVSESAGVESDAFEESAYGTDVFPELETSEPADTGQGDEYFDFGDLGDLLGGGETDAPAESSSEAADDLDSIFDTSTDDFAAQGEGAGEETADQAQDDFSAPSELLDDLDLETDTDFSADDFGGTPAENETGFDEGFALGDTELDSGDTGFDMSDMPGFSSDSEEIQPESDDSVFPTDSTESPDAFDMSDFPDFGEQSGTEPDAGGFPDDSETGFSMDDMPGFADEDFAMPESDESAADSGVEFPGTDDAEPSVLDAADFDVDSSASVDSVDFADPGLDSEIVPDDSTIPDSSFDSEKMAEFDIPGMSDVFKPSSKPSTDGPDEIVLTEDELSALRKTLASYPLNLRIACQQIIVEEAVAPDLMSNFIKLLCTRGSVKEAAAQAGNILGRPISIPKGFEKKTGEELEEEQASFSYIFVHSFLPVFRVFTAIALVAFSLGYLVWTFVIQPLRADAIYQRGYDQIFAGGYGRARDLFREAFAIHQKKIWFYRYAEAFRDERQYLYAEEKYDELLAYTASRNRRYIPDKQAVLDYAAFETNYMRNYEKADRLLRNNLLDYSIWDKEGLLALGDNNLAWGDIEKDRYEDAREAYAKYMERYGRTDPILERMLKYFIRTDNLGEVLQLQNYFMSSSRRQIEAPTLAELGGYLLDKRTEEIRGVPNPYIQQIGGIRDILLRAIRGDPLYPESYYHLSRYYNLYGNRNDEELTLSRAIQSFDAAQTETPRRLGYRIDALRRYADILIQRGEFFQAEEYIVRGVQLFEDGLSRRVIAASPEYGKLYADLGDLEFFTKDGNAIAALDYYHRSEYYGYAPPEIQYRMGAAYYQLNNWSEALEHFAAASFPLPFNRKILYALGNVSYLRGNYFAAQGYYDRLLEVLEADSVRFPLITPTNNEEQRELTERIMVVQNNLAVTLEALAQRTGDISYRSRAMGLYTESERAWDIFTRNPESMIRLRPSPNINAPSVNPAYFNVRNSLYPEPGFEPLFFLRIDKDLLEPSVWEELVPQGYRLAEGVPDR